MALAKPRIGLVLLRAEWFDSVVALPELVEAVASDRQDAISALSASFDVAGQWVVNSADSLLEAQKGLRATEVDLMVVAFQVWAEDFYVIPLLEAIGKRPLAVWCYLPWERPPRPATFVDVLRGSGPVGTLEGMGVIRNLGFDFTFTVGHPGHPRVVQDLMQAARAAQTVQSLRTARFGIVPHRNEQMQTTFVDEFRLRAELGPEVELISVRELAQVAEELTAEEVERYVTDLKSQYSIRGVTDDTLASAARASLGLARLAVDHRLDVMSLNDIEPQLHDMLGLRPCLYPPLFDENDVLVAIEGDLGAATAVYVLNRLTGSPILFCETWFWDEQDNLMVTGHAGPQNPTLAREGSVWISHDFEFAQSGRTEGAHLQFVARPGRVTMLQIRGTPEGWQAIVVLGEAVDTEAWIEGYPHAVVRLDVPVADFVRQVASVGTTQHWALAYGDALDSVASVCSLLGLPLLVIQ